FRFIESTQLIKSLEIDNLFNNDFTQLQSIYQLTNSDLNILYIQKDNKGFDSPGWLYSATVNLEGHVIEKCSLGFYTGDVFSAGPCQSREIKMKNGNRFLATCLDTTWNDPFNVSTIHETFILNPMGEIISQNITPFGKDTIYRFLAM